MELPSVDEMYEALNSPVIPMDSVKEEERASDMKTHTEILLDIVRSIQRLEDKIDLDKRAPSNVQPDPNLFGVTSNQLEF